MAESFERPKINHSDRLIATIQRASSNMDLDDYAKATGLDKELIFGILKGQIEEVDEETMNKLSLKH